jgi:hypothetical protein
MRPWTATALLAAGMVVGCMANGPATTAQPPRPANPPPASTTLPPAGPATRPALLPLILDRSDLRIGVTVQFARIPGPDEIGDLRQTAGLAHVVLALDAWPESYEALTALDLLPPESDVIVLLRGYPPSRSAAEAWNLVSARLRLVLLVPDAPPSIAVVQDLNTMRALERVIAEVDPPSRAGFERLQRPLSFLRVMV